MPLPTKRVVKMGIPRAHFVDCVSSGEVAFQSLDVRRAFLIGKDGEDYAFDPVQFVDDPKDAEVMLILGSNAPKTSLAAYRALFANISLPALCCNPDKWMITSGGLQPAPGPSRRSMKRRAAASPGSANPIPASIFMRSKCLVIPPACYASATAPNMMAGGRAAGLTTLLVQQGVSAEMSEDALEPQPDYVVTEFRW